MEKLLNNSEWVQTVWVWGSCCSDAWFFLKSWLQNVSAHHNWRSFLSILMFGQENGKHIEQFWSCKFACYFFSSKVACVSFNDGWNASVYVNFVWAPNDPKSLYFHFHFYSFLQRSPPLPAALYSGPSFRSLKAFRVYLIPEMMKRMVTLPNPAANYYVSMMSCDQAVTGGDNEHIHLMHL